MKQVAWFFVLCLVLFFSGFIIDKGFIHPLIIIAVDIISIGGWLTYALND